jgi:hypothetical protein
MAKTATKRWKKPDEVSSLELANVFHSLCLLFEHPLFYFSSWHSDMCYRQHLYGEEADAKSDATTNGYCDCTGRCSFYSVWELADKFDSPYVLQRTEWRFIYSALENAKGVLLDIQQWLNKNQNLLELNRTIHFGAMVTAAIADVEATMEKIRENNGNVG